MKILIDVAHPAQLNFYLNAIRILSTENEILLTYLKRGKLPHIVKSEISKIPNVKTLEVGSHNGNKLSIIFNANLFRIFKILWITLKFRPDIEMSNGFQAGIYPKLKGISSLHFSDDPERGKFFIGLIKFFSKEIYVPFFSDEKIKSFNALKEWAYLSPKYFVPNQEVLLKYDIKPKEYLFIREVSTKSINYSKQKANLIAHISNKIPSNYSVLLSLEDKSNKELYPKSWTILSEPIEDIHSLIYFSKVLISSGDSMAREGAMLGVPSIYCGIREMVANIIMINKNILFHKNAKDVPDFVESIIDNKVDFVEQEKFREMLKTEWLDPTEFIINKVKNIKTN